MRLSLLIPNGEHLEGYLGLLLQRFDDLGRAVTYHAQGNHPVKKFVVPRLLDLLRSQLSQFAAFPLLQQFQITAVELGVKLGAVKFVS